MIENWVNELNNCTSYEEIEILYVRLVTRKTNEKWTWCDVAENFSKHPNTPNWVLKDMMINPAAYHTKYPRNELKKRMGKRYRNYMGQYHCFISDSTDNEKYSSKFKNKIHNKNFNDKSSVSYDSETIIINFPKNLYD